jgi:hypothetical protein
VTVSAALSGKPIDPIRREIDTISMVESMPISTDRYYEFTNLHDHPFHRFIFKVSFQQPPMV